MKSRCFNPNHAAYHRYGGKGIVVCDEWLDFYEFYRWSKANGYESGLTIDREDSSKDYSPTNCRWITLAENSRGQSGTRWYEFRGGKYTISQIAEIVGIPAGTIYNRLYKGVPEDVAFVGSREEITLFMKGKNK